MAIPTDEQLLSAFARGKLARAISRHFGLQDKSELQATQSACARLHNAGAINFLDVVESAELQRLPKSDFFQAVDFFNKVLPEVEAPAVQIMTCVEALVAHGGDDLAANGPNAALRAWCAAKPSRALDVIDSARNGDSIAMRNLTFALEAIGAIDEARRFLSSSEPQNRRAAITALGRIPDPDPVSVTATIAALTGLIDGADEDIKAGILLATAFLLLQESAVPTPAATRLLTQLTTEPSDQVIHAAVHCLSTYKKGAADNVVALLLNAVLHIKHTDAAAIRELDWALQSLTSRGLTDAVMPFIAKLFLGDGELQPDQLAGFFRSLLQSHPEHFSRTVIQWLLSGEGRVCENLRKMFPSEEQWPKVIAFEDQLRSLSGDEQLLICQRAIGWLFPRPRVAASISISILRVADREIANRVQELLFYPLLLNYGGLRELLQTLEVDDPARPYVGAALAKYDAYIAGLRNVPLIEELKPSESHRYIQRVRMAEQNRVMMKQVEKKSVFFGLVKRSVVLHGRGSVGFVTDHHGRRHSVEVDMQSHNVTIEMPRMSVVDPIGLDYMLRIFRHAKIAI